MGTKESGLQCRSSSLLSDARTHDVLKFEGCDYDTARPVKAVRHQKRERSGEQTPGEDKGARDSEQPEKYEKTAGSVSVPFMNNLPCLRYGAYAERDRAHPPHRFHYIDAVSGWSI